MIIDDKIKRLREFESKVESNIILLAKDLEHLILDMNRDQIEGSGVSNDNQKITPKYTPFTVKIKKAKGQPTTHVTLHDTGEFLDSLFVVYGDHYFAIGADDPKVKKLERKYGKDIFGLIEKNLRELIDLIRPELQEKFKKDVS